VSTRRLSPRERAVLAELARGEGAKIAAHRLGLSASTVKAYVSSASRKLGASGIVQCYVALGWLRVPKLDRVPDDAWPSPGYLEGVGNDPAAPAARGGE
jgi:DNA-binding CsgD family transcriptional regulator